MNKKVFFEYEEKMKLKEMAQNLFADWTDFYDNLPEGIFSLFRYHLAYMLHLYPDFFFLEDAGSRVVSKGLTLSEEHTDRYVQKNIEVTIKNKKYHLYNLHSNSLKRNSFVDWNFHFTEKDYEIVSPFLHNKLKKTNDMLLNVIEIYRRTLPLEENQMITLINNFKSHPKYLLLIVMFFGENKAKQLTQHIIQTTPEIFKSLLNYPIWCDNFVNDFSLPTKKKQAHEIEREKGASEELKSDIALYLPVLKTMYDTYLPIRLDKKLDNKLEVRRLKI